jgi:hypothetical protein
MFAIVNKAKEPSMATETERVDGFWETKYPAFDRIEIDELPPR